MLLFLHAFEVFCRQGDLRLGNARCPRSCESLTSGVQVRAPGVSSMLCGVIPVPAIVDREQPGTRRIPRPIYSEKVKIEALGLASNYYFVDFYHFTITHSLYI